MHLSEILLARSAWLFELQSINPAGLAWGLAHAFLKERYHFLRYPSAPDEFDLTKGIDYQDGEFLHDGKVIAVSLFIYNTGVVADTRVSTEASDAFLEDIMEELAKLQFRPVNKLSTTISYDSHVVVSSDVNPTQLRSNLQSLVTLISELSGNPAEEVFGFSISANPNQQPTFQFERRANVPFSENKYFSRASLSTTKHKKILDELEKLLN